MTLSQVNLFCRWLLNLLVTTQKLLRLHENVNCLPVKEDVTCYLIQLYLLKLFRKFTSPCKISKLFRTAKEHIWTAASVLSI